jgi:hypothetical protein
METIWAPFSCVISSSRHVIITCDYDRKDSRLFFNPVEEIYPFPSTRSLHLVFGGVLQLRNLSRPIPPLLTVYEGDFLSFLCQDGYFIPLKQKSRGLINAL